MHPLEVVCLFNNFISLSAERNPKPFPQNNNKKEKNPKPKLKKELKKNEKKNWMLLPSSQMSIPKL
jgi:hypothetical protein